LGASHPEADINNAATATIKVVAKKEGAWVRIWSFFIIFGLERQR